VQILCLSCGPAELAWRPRPGDGVHHSWVGSGTAASERARTRDSQRGQCEERAYRRFAERKRQKLHRKDRCCGRRSEHETRLPCKCTFEALLDKYQLRDPALSRMGEIVRAIDMPFDEEPSPDVTRVVAAFEELRALNITDGDRLTRVGRLCDELYGACGGKG
jgi:Chromate resistance exported protein